MTFTHNNKDKILRAACYVRCSHEEQVLHGFTIEAQTAALKEHCEKEQYKIVDFYIDAGISGAKHPKKRPALQRLLKDVEAGKIDIICFQKLDRWVRNVSLYFDIQKILDKYGVVWQSLSESYNTLTADGKFQLTIYLAIAEQERNKTSERIQAVFDHKRKSKEITFGSHLVPYGYKIKHDDAGRRTLVKDEDTKHILEDFWNLAIKYQNIGYAGKTVSLEYGLEIRHSKWFEICNNELYSGVYRGIDEYCEPYVSREDWEKLQNRSTRVKQNKKDRIYKFSGLLICPKCGSKLSGTFTPTHRKSGYKEYKRYRCMHNTSSICGNMKTLSETKLEKWLLNNLSKLMEDEIAHVNVEKQKPRKKPKTNIAALKEKLRRLNVAYVAGGIEDDEYLSQQKELKDAIAKAEIAHANSDEQHDRDTTSLEEILATDFKSIYNTLNDMDRQRFWRTLIKEIHVDGNEPVSVIFH